MTNEEIEDAFTYHPPDSAQSTKYAILRNEAKEMAKLIQECCPVSREQSLAFTKLREAIMWSNAAIAIHTEKK